MRKCSKCGELKPLTAYYRAGGKSRDGLRGECIPCNLAAKAERHRRDPEPARQRTEQWRQANPEQYAANQAAFVASGGKKLADRRSHLKRKYGMTIEQYDAMLEAQGVFHLWSGAAGGHFSARGSRPYNGEDQGHSVFPVQQRPR